MATPGSTKYAFISADEIDEYRQNGLTEDRIRLINEKRQERAAELKRNYNQEKYPYITKEQYDQLVAQGATRTKLESLNQQQGEELRKFRSNMTLVPPSSNTAPQGRGPVPKRDLRIVLFGLSGEGLSATGDTLLGRKLFSGMSSSKSVEHGIQKDGRKITVSKISFSEDDIDNPGRMIEEAPDAFLLIVNISNHRDLKTQAKLWQNIKTYNEDIVARCILVLTHADLSFRGGDTLSSIYANYVDEKNAVPFGAVMKDLYPRIVALNNQSQSQQEMHVQQDQIMLMIDGVSQGVAPAQPLSRKPSTPPPSPGPYYPEDDPPLSKKKNKSWCFLL